MLALLQKGQKNDGPIWEFQRVVMGVRDFLIDLSEDRSLMLYSTVALGPRTQTPDFVCEGQLCTGH